MGKRRIKFDFLIHDLKVPLAVIEAGVLSLMQKRDKYGPLTDKQMKVMERVLRNTIVTRTLVNDALELGRSNEGIINKTEFTVSGFVEQTLVEIFDLSDHSTADRIKNCADLAALKETMSPQGVLLGINEEFWCRSLLLDESKVKQIFRNLLNNAFKYRRNQVELKVDESDNALFISVKDDGDGIPAGYHQKIFECYFQMDMRADHCVRGHGLGLAGVMVLIEDMGGQLFLESDAGKGATFSVKIPL